jgi:4a-hydroxytetrahydrobiopterin dehydratase
MADDTLTAEELGVGLRDLPEWEGDQTAISRTVQAATFLDAIALVDSVAAVSEERDHHPDMYIRWRTVTFTLCTHSAGGVTAKDLDLAAAIDGLAGQQDTRSVTN